MGLKVTVEELKKIFQTKNDVDTKITDALKNVYALFSSILIDITIPIDSWLSCKDDGDGYVYMSEIEVDKARGEHFPSVSIHKESLKVALEADLCPTILALDGRLQLWARSKPSEEIKATLVLYSRKTDAEIGGIGGGTGTYELPIATAFSLGGVKIGTNIDVTDDGTISTTSQLDPSEVATDEEVDEMLQSVFGK